MSEQVFRVLELCAGGGGQALGLEQAGFVHEAAVELDSDACTTLSRNRPSWDVVERDVRSFSGHPYEGIDLVAGGVPCPPFSIAGKKLGSDDERDLFPAALAIIKAARPRAVLLENVKGLSQNAFAGYRRELFASLRAMGYVVETRLLQASDLGVPQLRPRYVIVALRADDMRFFTWPKNAPSPATVGEVLHDLMAAKGWPGAECWRMRANAIAPTLVGGSKKHGGPDLGPTRARARWAELGVDGKGLVEFPPGPGDPIDLSPRLTVRMAARLQGFPDDWLFAGGKTSAYRQVGNAFPPPVAAAVGRSIRSAMLHSRPSPAPSAPRLLESRVSFS